MLMNCSIELSWVMIDVLKICCSIELSWVMIDVLKICVWSSDLS